MAIRILSRAKGFERAEGIIEVRSEGVLDPIRALGSRESIRLFVSPFQQEDEVRYKTRSAREWERISVPEVIWGRDRKPTGAPFRRLSQVFGAAGAAFPGRDSNRLLDSVAGRRNSFIRIRKRLAPAEIGFGSRLGYAEKHLNGQQEKFDFDFLDRERLRRRVPPPSKKLKFRGLSSRKPIRKLGNRAPKNELRPFYVLLNWATKRYGRTGDDLGFPSGSASAKVPRRSWIGPYSQSTIGRARLILEGKLTEFFRREAAISLGRVQRREARISRIISARARRGI